MWFPDLKPVTYLKFSATGTYRKKEKWKNSDNSLLRPETC